MSRKARLSAQHLFKLYPDDPSHQALQEHLAHLSETGQASTWIIATLIEALNHLPASHANAPYVSPVRQPASLPVTSTPARQFKPAPKTTGRK